MREIAKEMIRAESKRLSWYFRILSLSMISILLTGCIRGYLYTNTVEPYCTDMQSTPRAHSRSDSGIVSVSIPRLPGARTVWSSNAIGDAAKQAGIKEVYYCDLKRFSVLGGIYGSESLVVYGR
jgi:hypothetical protein